MINNVVITGKVVELPKLRETASGIKYTNVVLEVTRPFRNSSGEYESDCISVKLWRGIAETASQVCKIGDLLGVKGCVRSYRVNKDNVTYYSYEIVAEYVSFLKTEVY